jgi:polar amino acid transport system substrate-binding protein
MKRIEASVIRRGVELLVLLTLAWPALAADKGAEIRAVVNIIPPAVMEDRGHLTGFSVDLWNAVAAKLNAQTSYQTAPDVAATFDALRSGKADVAMTGYYYTAERDREFDFSYSILNAGQQVMVRSSAPGAEDRPLRTFLKILFSRSMLYWLIAALLLVLVPAHVIWLLDRRSKDGISTSENYFPGILDAMAWTAEAMLGQAPRMPGQKFAQLLAIPWLFTGVVFVAFFTAQLTTSLTLDQIRGTINGPNDLPGKAVATLAGTTSADYLREIGARADEFQHLEEVYSALLSGRVDAVVLPAPALRYYAAHDGAGKVRMAGPEFRKSDAAFVVPLNSPLRRKVDSALVTLHEDGTYQRLYEKWFGKE